MIIFTFTSALSLVFILYLVRSGQMTTRAANILVTVTLLLYFAVFACSCSTHREATLPYVVMMQIIPDKWDAVPIDAAEAEATLRRGGSVYRLESRDGKQVKVRVTLADIRKAGH